MARHLTKLAGLFAAVLVATAVTASAEGRLDPPLASDPFGMYGGIEYVTHRGRFQGETKNGAYRVPYEIVVPVNRARHNGRLLLEPPHFGAGPGARDIWLGRDFVLAKGFSHAQVGWGSLGLQQLDPEAFASGDAFILAPPETCALGLCPGPTDFEIVADFAEALRSDAVARGLVGSLTKIYGVGFSNSTEPLHGLLRSGPRHGLFDLTLLITPSVGAHWEPSIHRLPRDAGRIMVFSSEADIILFGAAHLRDNDRRYRDYRTYEVAGAPHVPSAALGLPSPLGNDWSPFLRALFVAGDRWAEGRESPPPSVALEAAPQGEVDPAYGFPTGIARDGDLNARGGVRAPDLAVGRMRFRAVLDFSFPSMLFGSVEDLACVPAPDGGVRFASHGAYVHRFVRQANRLRWGRLLLPDDWKAVVKGAVDSDVGKPGSCP